jgi:hypothetical protein
MTAPLYPAPTEASSFVYPEHDAGPAVAALSADIDRLLPGERVEEEVVGLAYWAAPLHGEPRTVVFAATRGMTLDGHYRNYGVRIYDGLPSAIGSAPHAKLEWTRIGEGTHPGSVDFGRDEGGRISGRTAAEEEKDSFASLGLGAPDIFNPQTHAVVVVNGEPMVVPLVAPKRRVACLLANLIGARR